MKHRLTIEQIHLGDYIEKHLKKNIDDTSHTHTRTHTHKHTHIQLIGNINLSNSLST